MAKVSKAAPAVLRSPEPERAWTMEERLDRIEASSQRILNYVQFMREVGNLHGTSKEAKEKAVLAFYELMTRLEHQLGRIQEDLQLG